MTDFETKVHNLLKDAQTSIRKLSKSGGKLHLETDINGIEAVDVDETWQGWPAPKTGHEACHQASLQNTIKDHFIALCDSFKTQLPIRFTISLTQKEFIIRSQTQILLRAHLNSDAMIKSELRSFARLHSKNQPYGLYLIHTEPGNTDRFESNNLFEAVDITHAVEQMRASYGEDTFVYSAAKLTPITRKDTSYDTCDVAPLKDAITSVCNQMDAWRLPPNFNGLCDWTLYDGFAAVAQQTFKVQTVATSDDKKRAHSLWRDLVDTFDVLAQIMARHPGFHEHKLVLNVSEGQIQADLVTQEEDIPLDDLLRTLSPIHSIGPVKRYGVQKNPNDDLHYSYGHTQDEAIKLFLMDQPQTRPQNILLYELEPFPYHTIFAAEA